jgi:hypothetical protein
MDFENTSVALGRVLGALAFCSKPIMLVLWVFKALFRLVTWPIRTPWKLVMWCLAGTITLLVEYEASAPFPSQTLQTHVITTDANTPLQPFLIYVSSQPGIPSPITTANPTTSSPAPS